MKGPFVGALVASLLVSSTAFGEVVVRSYSGVYQFTTVIGGDTDAAALFNPGDTFEVTLTYDTDAPRTFDDGVTARYDGAGSVHVSYSNGYAAGLVNERITVRNNALLVNTYTWDSFGLSAFPTYGASIGAATLVNVDLNLAETQAGTVFSSTDLVALPDLSLFTNPNLLWVELVFQQSGMTNYVRGIITGEGTVGETGDDVVDLGDSVLDPATGLEWLDLDLPAPCSLSDLETAVPGCTFLEEGWQLAGVETVRTFLHNAGIHGDSDPPDPDAIRLINLLGPTIQVFDGNPDLFVTEIWGITSTPSGNGFLAPYVSLFESISTDASFVRSQEAPDITPAYRPTGPDAAVVSYWLTRA